MRCKRCRYTIILISIAAIKRFQGSYGSTLVAQGAFSAYDTDAVRRAGGWEQCAGEDRCV